MATRPPGGVMSGLQYRNRGAQLVGDSDDEVAADLFLPVQRAGHLVEGGRQLAQLGGARIGAPRAERSSAVMARVTAISLATGRVIRRAANR